MSDTLATMDNMDFQNIYLKPSDQYYRRLKQMALYISKKIDIDLFKPENKHIFNSLQQENYAYLSALCYCYKFNRPDLARYILDSPDEFKSYKGKYVLFGIPVMFFIRLENLIRVAVNLNPIKIIRVIHALLQVQECEQIENHPFNDIWIAKQCNVASSSVLKIKEVLLK